jgi:hypothetical protein
MGLQERAVAAYLNARTAAEAAGADREAALLARRLNYMSILLERRLGVSQRPDSLEWTYQGVTFRLSVDPTQPERVDEYHNSLQLLRRCPECGRATESASCTSLVDLGRWLVRKPAPCILCDRIGWEQWNTWVWRHRVEREPIQWRQEVVA